MRIIRSQGRKKVALKTKGGPRLGSLDKGWVPS